MANRLQVLNTCQSYHQKDPDMSKFNAISYEQELEAAGVPKEQATVHAKALGQIMTEVVFRSDLKTLEDGLRNEIEQAERRLSEKIEALRTSLTEKLESFRAIMDARLTSIEHELTIHRWLLALMITLQIGTFATLVKLISH